VRYLYARRVKRDANHAKIVRALEKAGRRVEDMAAVGGGFPDIIVHWGGRVVFMEIKNPDGRDRDESSQQKFRARWTGPPVVIVRSEAEALAATGVQLRDQSRP